MKRQSVRKASVSNNFQAKSTNSDVKIDIGRFSFRNGDSYEGKYALDIGKRILVRKDEGVYVTDNFDVYDGKWNCDKFACNDEFHIRYNNNAQYKGNIDANGTMNGAGTYIFPDGSSLIAIWSQNKPVSDVIYKEPFGYEWIPESISNNQVSFTTGNHFWNEICKATFKKSSPSCSQHE